MKDELRDAICDLRHMPFEDADTLAKSLATAIRAEIDERLARAREDAWASGHVCGESHGKPQAAEPRRWMLAKDGRKHLEAPECPQHGCTLFEVDRARRNPYEDWATWDDERNMYSARDIREARWKGWNEGAQIAGGRDA